MRLETTCETLCGLLALDAAEGGIEGAVRSTVLAALAYADLFDYPLTLDELTKYQVGTAFTQSEIARSLALPSSGEVISSTREFYLLKGREALADLRLRRQRPARKTWRRARLYARVVARLPLVRMVAVTGALAVDNVAEVSDIDLLVVCKAGRVWLCRRQLIILVRLARLFGDDICPNYILSEESLDLQQRDFFTAHELAQMVPISGSEVYSKMLTANRWALRYLPCAFPVRKVHAPQRGPSPARRVMESLLAARALDGWEQWELKRLRAKLRPLLGDTAEVVCSPAQCKGHTGLHRRSAMSRYEQRLRDLGLYDGFRQRVGEAATSE